MTSDKKVGIKAQEWMILFDGKIKRSEKILYLEDTKEKKPTSN